MRQNNSFGAHFSFVACSDFAVAVILFTTNSPTISLLNECGPDSSGLPWMGWIWECQGHSLADFSPIKKAVKSFLVSIKISPQTLTRPSLLHLHDHHVVLPRSELSPINDYVSNVAKFLTFQRSEKVVWMCFLHWNVENVVEMTKTLLRLKRNYL